MPIAYSYIRFSQISQLRGGSLARQGMTAHEYAEKEGLTLDTTLKMQDLGVSAFKGLNATEGALSKFMEAVENGKVVAGSFLLIEDMDRLTRLPVMEGLAVFQRIINGGVTLVTLKNGTKYSKESLLDNWTLLMPVLFDMSRGNAESERKSYLLGKAWRKKKDEASAMCKPLGNNAPLWLTFERDSAKYLINEARATVVRRIFQLSVDGYGRGAIIAMLNKEGVPSFKEKSWSVTSVNRLLSNRAVLGEYQPRLGSGKTSERKPDGPPITGFFPVIVSLDLFNRSQQASQSRYIHRATKQTKNFNIWQGVAKCGMCLASMHIVTKQYKYLVCSASRKGLCTAKGIRLDASELVFRELLAKVGDNSLVEESSASLTRQLQAAQGELSNTQERYNAQQTIQTEFPTRAGAQALSAHETAIDLLQTTVTTLTAQLASDTVWEKNEFFSKLDIVLATRNGREQANALLKRLKVRVIISKDRADTKYVVSQDGKILLGIIHNSDGRIDAHAFTQNQLDKVKDQDFDGSIESSYDMLISERNFDFIFNGKRWDGATLEKKIAEMLARVDVSLAPNTPQFQTMKDRLSIDRWLASPEWVAQAQRIIKAAQ